MLVLVAIAFVCGACARVHRDAAWAASVPIWRNFVRDYEAVRALYAPDAKVCMPYDQCGSFSEIFDPFYAIMLEFDSLPTVLTRSGNWVTFLFSDHVVFKNGCHALFKGVANMEFDANGKIKQHISLLDNADGHLDRFNKCMAENVPKQDL
eukprot:g40397.t1